jgi:serine/threonine protein kinase
MSQLSEFESAVIDDKYRVERCLGVGGMGADFLATHVWTDRPVALKFILPSYASVSAFLERFKREARAARVEHLAARPSGADCRAVRLRTNRQG